MGWLRALFGLRPPTPWRLVRIYQMEWGWTVTTLWLYERGGHRKAEFVGGRGARGWVGVRGWAVDRHLADAWLHGLPLSLLTIADSRTKIIFDAEQSA